MKRLKTIVVTAVVGVLLAGGLTALARCQPYLDDTLTKRDTAGKVIRFDGLVELTALKQCAQIDNATRERMKPRVLDWVLDVQQQVIDNIDFIAEIEPFDGRPGVFDNYDPVDQKLTERVNTYGRQLNAAGTIINQLEFRKLIEQKQAEAARKLVYDYDQAVLQEVLGAPGVEQKETSRHLYRVGHRDALGMFHRLLDRAAALLGENAGALQLPESAEVSKLVADVKAAADKDAKRKAVKALLNKLPLVQQRGFLNKVRDLAPIKDPFGIV